MGIAGSMLSGTLEDPEFQNCLQDIALKLRSSKRVAFVAGAGISCNAGIPDFRSKDGLYELVKRKFPDTFVKGKDLFDAILFRDEKSTEIFYSFIAGLKEATLQAKPTPTHHLLKTLKDKKKLLRVYTQNIDGLEYKVGLGASDAIQLHGDIHQLKCMQCSHQFEWSEKLTEEMLEGDAPDCTNCVNVSLARQLSGKRSTAIGQLRPDIVLYGEEHPKGDEIANTLKKDCSRAPGLLLVAGTSLKVHGIKRLVKVLAQATHAAGGIVVLINKSTLSNSEWGPLFDYHVASDVDEWGQDLKARIPNFFEKQTKIKVERKRKSENIMLAKRTKSDPYGETMMQNTLLRSPEITHSFGEPLSQNELSPLTSPSLDFDEPSREITPLSLKNENM